MTDSNSAAKYFYFCRVGGGRGAEAEVALQTHPNVCLLSTVCATLTPMQVAEVRHKEESIWLAAFNEVDPPVGTSANHVD